MPYSSNINMQNTVVFNMGDILSELEVETALDNNNIEYEKTIVDDIIYYYDRSNINLVVLKEWRGKKNKKVIAGYLVN